MKCDDHALAVIQEARYLGATTDFSLSWNAQTDCMIKKAQQVVGTLWRHRNTLSIKSKKLFYQSLIESKSLYGTDQCLLLLLVCSEQVATCSASKSGDLQRLGAAPPWKINAILARPARSHEHQVIRCRNVEHPSPQLRVIQSQSQFRVKYDSLLVINAPRPMCLVLIPTCILYLSHYSDILDRFWSVSGLFYWLILVHDMYKPVE